MLQPLTVLVTRKMGVKRLEAYTKLKLWVYRRIFLHVLHTTCTPGHWCMLEDTGWTTEKWGTAMSSGAGMSCKELKILHPEESLPHLATKPADPGCKKANPNPKPSPKSTLTWAPSPLVVQIRKMEEQQSCAGLLQPHCSWNCRFFGSPSRNPNPHSPNPGYSILSGLK